LLQTAAGASPYPQVLTAARPLNVVCFQVLSPAMAAAVDVTALQLLDLPSLVALALGVLAEEFGWIAKSFPQAFSVSKLCSCKSVTLAHVVRQ
jgi:hypothetical protein